MITALDPDYLPRQPFWEGVAEDLTSRGALAGAIAAIYGVVTIAWWVLHVWKVRLRSSRVPVRILVTGTRGKSSVVRLVHSALSHAGYRVFAKTTGTAARSIEPDGREHPTRRLGQVSILEMLTAMAHAGRQGVDAVVVECMAVNPDLIRQLSSDIVRPTIVAVTNSHIDHMESQGDSEESVMLSLAEAVTGQQVVVTSEPHAACVWELQQQVNAQGGRLLAVDGSLARGRDGQLLLPGEYADNVAVGIGVGRACTIPDAQTVEGMRQASQEPQAQEFTASKHRGLVGRYWNLGSINDANSVLPAVVNTVGPRRPGVPRLALLAGRSDRPLRAAMFAGLVSQDLFDGVIVSGGPEYVVVRQLLDCGWPRERILSVGLSYYVPRHARSRVLALVRNINPAAETFEFISLENIHVPFAVSMEQHFSDSPRIDSTVGETGALV